MATYLSRDFLGQATSASRVHTYLFSLFLRRVLKYTYVGDTNFGINSVGALLIATGDSTPTAAPTFAVGHKAGINYGGGLEYYVGVPAADHVVSAGDVNRILVLKSTANPLHNSGLFRVTGVDVPNNRFQIDYRSTELPPAEADDSIEWYLYETETSASIPNAGAVNGGTGYRGSGTSTTSRLILQSPHASGWQVRICNETSVDYSSNNMTHIMTVVPGFGGNSAGDFPVGGRHLHGAQWNDVNDFQRYGGQSLGVGHSGSTLYRFTFIGDDGGQSMAAMMRYVSGSTTYQMFLMGIPDNEPAPLPDDDVSRLFVFGDGSPSNNGGYLNDISWTMGYFQTNQSGEGMAFGNRYAQPVGATLGAWNYLYGGTTNFPTTNPIFDTTAGDSPYSSATDLLAVAIFAGTTDTHYLSGGTQTLPWEPRFIGTAPFVRQGRANFGANTLTTDAGKSWMHFRNGVYLQWGGPALVP